MNAIAEPLPSISPPVRKAVDTGADTESPVTPEQQRNEQLRHVEQIREAWQVIEGKLIEWGCDPSQLDEEGTKTPSRATIQLAIRVATALSRQGVPAPTRVVPDAHGGIAFEIQGKNDFDSVHIQPDGSVEHRLFQNHRLVRREPWALGTADNE